MAENWKPKDWDALIRGEEGQEVYLAATAYAERISLIRRQIEGGLSVSSLCLPLTFYLIV